MKWFWSIMVLLVIATGVLLARRSGERVPAAALELIATTEPAAPESPPVVPPVLQAPAPAASEAPKEIVAPVATSEPVGGAPAPVDASPVESAAKIEPKEESTPKPEEAAPAALNSAKSEESPAADAPVPAEATPALFRDQFEIVPARKKPGENGVTIYDERFPVKGAGTPEDPMEVSWELLVSASETFQPRMGKKRLPERITMLDGKHVRVTGYVAFPIMAASQNEMLSMRNMWDGCCIGVPPTPYDALEVKLKGAATGRDRFTAFGTVEGTIKVDPYIKGNWLLGLYLMEDATLSQLKEGGDPGKHGGM